MKNGRRKEYKSTWMYACLWMEKEKSKLENVSVVVSFVCGDASDIFFFGL